MGLGSPGLEEQAARTVKRYTTAHLVNQWAIFKENTQLIDRKAAVMVMNMVVQQANGVVAILHLALRGGCSPDEMTGILVATITGESE